MGAEDWTKMADAAGKRGGIKEGNMEIHLKNSAGRDLWLPVNPEEITIKREKGIETVNILSFGEFDFPKFKGKLVSKSAIQEMEAGFPYKALQRALNFRMSEISGCLITHEHLDHSKAAKDVMKAGINVYTSQGTADARGLSRQVKQIARIPRRRPSGAGWKRP